MNRMLEDRMNKSIANKEILNSDEAAFYLRISKRQLCRYVANLNLPKHFGRGTGMNPVYKKSEIDEWYRGRF